MPEPNDGESDYHDRVGLREYIEALLIERDRRYSQGIEALTKLIETIRVDVEGVAQRVQRIEGATTGRTTTSTQLIALLSLMAVVLGGLINLTIYFVTHK